jgi:hypothetical protein
MISTLQMKKKKNKPEAKYHVECNADENQLRYISIAKKQIKHHHDKFALIKYLKKSVGFIAIIDEDPQAASENIFDACELVSDAENLIEYKYTKNKHKIIVIRPQLEGWLLKQAKQVKLDLKDIGLPKSFSGLHGLLHKEPGKHQQLIAKLREKKSKGIQRLIELLGITS